MNKIIILILCLCCAFMVARAEEGPALNPSDANIVGHVVDRKTGEHLSFITIFLKGTTIGTSTDGTGHYYLKNLPEGEFTVVMKTMGYKTVETPVTLKKGKTLEINFEAEEEALSLDGVVVSANRNETTRRMAPSQEVLYKVAKSGKINWNRTIKTQKPYVQDMDVFYLDFVTKKNSVKENELITLIHEYCVYESFERIGWLYTEMMPKKPVIVKQERLFRSVLKDKIANTFNDKNRMLFRHMLAIIDFEGDKDSDKNYRYGTYRFEYIWEKMIDKVFGIENKADYFPKTTWYVNGSKYDNASLEPDTVMLYGTDVYVLDAKYYKYGVTGKTWDLPESTSINKQITYGEYIANEDKFKKKHGENMKVYNAFLMPFDSLKSKYPNNANMLKVGQAVSNWKDNTEEYHKIQGVLLDVKTLMSINVRQEMKEIEKLAKLIEN